MRSRERTDLGRRKFSREAIAALLGGVTVTVCGGRTEAPPNPLAPAPPPTSPNPSLPTPSPPTDKIGVFLANHRHEAVITSAQLIAGGGLRLDIRGAANHPHILSLAAHEVEAIRRGEEVGKESTEVKGHTHFVTFNADGGGLGTRA